MTASVASISRALKAGPAPALRDLAQMLTGTAWAQTGETRLAIVAHSMDDLTAKLDRAMARLVGAESEWFDPSGATFSERPLSGEAKVAFPFPGQGSQSPDMLGEAALMFPEIIDAFDAIDRALDRCGFSPIGPLVFPPTPRDDQESESSACGALGRASRPHNRPSQRPALDF